MDQVLASADAARAPQVRPFVPGYELLEEIGAGASAVVYRAYQRSVDRHVAIKVLRSDSQAADEGLLKRFELEARIIGRLRHPNTIRLYDVGRTKDGNLYFVTELLVGRSLAHVLSTSHLKVARVLEIATEVAGSLIEAHAAGVIHRDIKPANIFLDRVGDEEVVKVLDFGIARELSGTRLTKAEVCIGSPTYMSPEQISSVDVDHRSDIYSLGVLIYHLLAGRPPFEANTTLEVLVMHLTKRPPPIWKDRTEVPASHVELERLVLQMLEKSAHARPQSMVEVRDRLERARLGLRDAAPMESLYYDTLDSEELGVATQSFLRECSPLGNVSLAYEQLKVFLSGSRLGRAGVLLFVASLVLTLLATLLAL